MPFPFRYICDLLQELDDEAQKKAQHQAPSRAIIEAWFSRHRAQLDAPGIDACAVLSTLLPERRTDRVYFLQVARLQSIIGQALMLGASRVQELRRYTTPGLGVDLADCVEGILKRTPNPVHDNGELTVEEIDGELSSIAAACRFSSPAVQNLPRTQGAQNQNRLLGNIYKRLTARDAKWFTRLVLKNYQPVVLDGNVVLRAYHVLLPQAMKVRDDLATVTAVLRHVSPTNRDQAAITSILKPCIGTKVGRQPWFKGRSIKNCMAMIGKRQVSCEQKIDGEYCQIHIDLRNPRNQIQIFSKSGKDSTADRGGLHKPIRDSLELGTVECPFKFGCILEGELVVYSTQKNKILPFHKIRKHVSRSGSFLGTAKDSQPHEHEHLMILYYDVLLIDDESLLGVRRTERFKRLRKIITSRKGYAELVSRQVISFSRRSAASELREIFAKCIVARGEGVVLKPDEPYFDFSVAPNLYSCCNIKFKKAYVQGWGDVGDFAVVGASYDAAKAKEYRVPNLKWTHFHIGCLENKAQARARVEKPRFRMTNVVELSGPTLSTFWAQARPITIPIEQNNFIVLDYAGDIFAKQPTEIYADPLVFDMRCFAFDKEPNTNFWSMRFPMVSKIHYDRSYLDTVTFSGLQEIAQAATETPELEDSQEMRRWISALEKADPRGVAFDAVNQRSTSVESTPSPTNTHAKKTVRPPVTDTIREEIEHQRSRTTASVHPPPCLPTPPTSSQHVPNSSDPSSASSKKTPVSAAHTKRSLVGEPGPNPSAKRRRTDCSASNVKPPIIETSTASASPTPARHREPLGQIDANRSSQHETSSQASNTRNLPSTGHEKDQSPTAPRIALEPASSCRRSRRPSSCSPSTTRGKNHSHDDNQSFPAAGCCSHLGSGCAFANWSVLLSPCIASYAWVTENLLREHGIEEFVTDPQLWSQLPSSPSPTSSPTTSAGASSSSSPPSHETRRHHRVRKVCLVESRRREATEDLLRRIEDAGLKRRIDGEREWVPVYDWRILESITEQERSGKQGRGPGYDPWRRWYVGIA